MQKILIDENLSPSLAADAQQKGFLCSHVNHLRKTGTKDWELKDHDAVIACFDEESQYMLEGSSEPAFGVVFSPQKPEEVRCAVRAIRCFVALNVELFQMVEELQELC